MDKKDRKAKNYTFKIHNPPTKTKIKLKKQTNYPKNPIQNTKLKNKKIKKKKKKIIIVTR